MQRLGTMTLANGLGWGLYDQKLDQHCIPIGDWRPHEHSRNCWCNPVEIDDDPHMISHKAMDGREAYERGELKLH